MTARARTAEMPSHLVDELFDVKLDEARARQCPAGLAPGVHEMTAEAYHALPHLSSHEARDLLACPAKYRYAKDHPEESEHKPAYDLGTAVHVATLRADTDTMLIVEASSWQTKGAQQAREEARAAGLTPLLAKDWDKARAMAAAIHAHPLAHALIAAGKPEQTLIWRDEATGVWCRARVDVLAPQWLCDVKTADSADPAGWRWDARNYGYDVQDRWYQGGAAALGLGSLPFYFVVVEKKPPYLVSVIDLHSVSLGPADDDIRRAREIWRDCDAAGIWPAYTQPDEIATVSVPRRRRED